MPLPINPVINADLSTVVESERINLYDLIGPDRRTPVSFKMFESSLIDAYLEVDGHKIYENVELKYSDITSTSTLHVVGESASTYNTPLFVNLSISTFGYMSVAVLTKEDPSQAVLREDLINSKPTAYFEGYTPETPNNKLLTTQTQNDATSVTNLAVVSTVDNATIADGKPYVFATDYVAGHVHRIDPETSLVVQTHQVNKPHGLAYTPTKTYDVNARANLLVSSPADNKVYIYDGSIHALIHTVNTGEGPHGVVGEPSTELGSYSFWVACFDADRVEHWTFSSNNNTGPVRDFYYSLDANSGPYDIKLDEHGNAIVTCLISDKIAICPPDGVGNIVYSPVDTDPWELTIMNGFAFVACAGSNTLCSVNLATLELKTMDSINNATHIHSAKGKLYVGSFTRGQLVSYSVHVTGGSVTLVRDIVESDRMCEGITSDTSGDKVYATNMHNDMPALTQIPDNTPDGVDIPSMTDIDPDTDVNTVDMTVSGVKTSSIFIVPSTPTSPVNPYILKNSINVGGATTASNNDKISVSVRTPDVDPLEIPVIYIPLVYNGGVTMWVITLKPGVLARTKGWIQGG